MKHEYQYDLVDGHIIVKDGETRLLIDTGAPSSVGENTPLDFAGASHNVAGTYLGVTPCSLTSNVGSPVHALIGVDVLNHYDMTINPPESVLTLTDGEQSLSGNCIALDQLKGIPIVPASVAGQTVRMFFDTGAKLSYLHPEMTAKYHRDGSEEDFYPSLGKFQTDTFSVPVSLGTEEIVLRVGVLPEPLQMTLMMGNTSGILGTAILATHRVCFAPRRKILVFTRL